MSDCVYPCPCGWFLDPQKACTCASAVVTKYQKRISGDQASVQPLLEYYSSPLPDPLLKKVRKIWQENKENVDQLLKLLAQFHERNPLTRADRPQIPEFTADDLKLICYMAVL